MVEVKNVEVHGLARAMNAITNSYTVGEINTRYMLSDDGERHSATARKLGANMDAHQSHDSWLRGVIVQFDMKYPLYFSPEFQRYHFAQIIMSQSTMHSLDKMITGEIDPYNKYVTDATKAEVTRLYYALEGAQDSEESYEAFMRLRSNLPCGFEMWMTVSTNYLQLKTIWVQRHNHRLREDWGEGFCRDFIEKLPYFKELCLGEAYDGQ